MPRGILTRLLIAFGLAILSFCGSSLYAGYVTREVDDSARSIARNAMPSIEHLAETRGELRLLDVAVTRYEASPTAANRAAVTSARDRMNIAFERYLAEPETFPGEQELWAELHGSLATVDHTVEAALVDIGAGRSAGNRVTLAMNSATTSIRRAIDFNADAAGWLAQRIENDHRRAVDVSLLLDGVSTLLTILVAFLAVRALQHHHRIVDERNKLVERRAEELEQFAGRVAHDILGPLSATRMAVGHVGAQLSDPAMQRMLERGQRGVERVSTIVDGLLRFARAGARPEPGAVSSVAPIVQSVAVELEPIAQAAGVTLSVAEAPPCAVYGHAGVINSLVENLARNAIKYMGDRRTREVEVRVLPQSGFVRIEVEDSGPGIPPALYETIWDPHVRGRTEGKPGIGLGLATVKRIAEAHGGRVGFRSRLDVGTTFWVELPRADYDDESREKRASAQAGK
jgi:signal transduction histidine kinase